MLGNIVFGNFWFSQCWEMLFLAIFGFPNVGKRSFRCFSVFPTLGNVFFRVFVVSQTWERPFPPFSTFPNIGKTVLVFCQENLILDERADAPSRFGISRSSTSLPSITILSFICLWRRVTPNFYLRAHQISFAPFCGRGV